MHTFADIAAIATLLGLIIVIRRNKARIARLEESVKTLTRANARLWDRLDDSVS